MSIGLARDHLRIYGSVRRPRANSARTTARRSPDHPDPGRPEKASRLGGNPPTKAGGGVLAWRSCSPIRNYDQGERHPAARLGLNTKLVDVVFSDAVPVVQGARDWPANFDGYATARKLAWFTAPMKPTPILGFVVGSETGSSSETPIWGSSARHACFVRWRHFFQNICIRYGVTPGLFSFAVELEAITAFYVREITKSTGFVQNQEQVNPSHQNHRTNKHSSLNLYIMHAEGERRRPNDML